MISHSEYDNMTKGERAKYKHSLALRQQALDERLRTLQAEHRTLTMELRSLALWEPQKPVPMAEDFLAKVRVVHQRTRVSAPRIVLRRMG